jgi:hypothetical protein
MQFIQENLFLIILVTQLIDIERRRMGQVLTRKSMDLFCDSLSLMRPSCGTRRSAVLSRDMTLIRAAILWAKAIGGRAISLNMPSMRKRTR